MLPRLRADDAVHQDGSALLEGAYSDMGRMTEVTVLVLDPKPQTPESRLHVGNLLGAVALLDELIHLGRVTRKPESGNSRTG